MTTPANNRRAGLLAVALLATARLAIGTELPAATPPPPAAADDAVATEARDDRADAHDEFRRLFDAGDYAAAVVQARQVVALTEAGGAAQVEDLQVALMNLALAQQRAGDYVSAETSYLRVIELIEASGRPTRPRLARAYAGLGLTYYAGRRYDLAADTLERAIVLNRRTEGLFNADQLPLLEKQIDSLTELGRADEALLVQRYELRVVERRHGTRSLPYVHRLESLGRWYTRVRSFDAARATLRKAAELVESLEGPDSLELVGPLGALAENARRWLTDPMVRQLSGVDEQRSSMFHDPVMPAPPGLSPSTIAAEGLKALERAAEIVDGAADAAPAVVAAVHSQLGDWHTARQAPDRARPSYVRAWQAAGAAPDGERLRETLFGTPQLIHYVLPDSWDRYARRPPEEIERRDVELELTVTAAGTVKDAFVVSESVDEKLVNQALRAIGTARYRPRLADGAPVDTTGVRFVQPFWVLRESAPAVEPPPVPAPAQPATPAPPSQGGG